MEEHMKENKEIYTLEKGGRKKRDKGSWRQMRGERDREKEGFNGRERERELQKCEGWGGPQGCRLRTL